MIKYVNDSLETSDVYQTIPQIFNMSKASGKCTMKSLTEDAQYLLKFR